MVKCQETRSRTQNRKTARRLLGDRLEELELGEGARTRVKAREKSRRKGSADKKKRRKYRALADGKGGDGERVGEEGWEGDVQGGDGGEVSRVEGTEGAQGGNKDEVR